MRLFNRKKETKTIFSIIEENLNANEELSPNFVLGKEKEINNI